jgi:hypothetical protein
MKTLIILAVSILCLSFYAEDYIYKGKKVSPSRFDKMFEYFQDYLYVYNNTVIDSRTENEFAPNEKARLGKIPKIGDHGYIDGKVMQILNDGILLTKQYQTYKVKDVDTSNIVDNQEVVFYGVRTGIFNYNTVLGAGKRIPEITPISKINKEQFKKYLKTAENLFLYKQKTTTIKGRPAKKEKCTTCKGKGKVANTQKNNRLSKPFVKCRWCSGLGYRIAGREIKDRHKTIWVKKLIK